VPRASHLTLATGRPVRNRISDNWPFVLCIGVVFLMGCLPGFENPLPSDDLTVDKAILGVWHLEGSRDEQQLNIFPRKSGWVDVAWIYDINSDSSTDGINVIVFEGYVVEIERQRLICLRQRQKDFDEDLSDVCNWFIYHYEITDEGILRTKPLSKAAMKRLIEDGTLKGTIKKHLTGEDVTVTSSSRELADVIAKKGVKQLLEEDDDLSDSWSRTPPERKKDAQGNSR